MFSRSVVISLISWKAGSGSTMSTSAKGTFLTSNIQLLLLLSVINSLIIKCSTHLSLINRSVCNQNTVCDWASFPVCWSLCFGKSQSLKHQSKRSHQKDILKKYIYILKSVGWALFAKLCPANQVACDACTCAHPPLPHSLGTPQRSTTWTCTHTWWHVWCAWCCSLVHSTWPHSCLCLWRTYCTLCQLCPRIL